jgi:hypothetical protein
MSLQNKILVLGATGATGSLVLRRLLENQEVVIALVRSPTKLSTLTQEFSNLEVIEGTALNSPELSEALQQCKAVISCLGHTIDFKGIYGKPRKLVTDSLKKVCHTIQDLDADMPVKVILMNTTAFRNGATDPQRSFGEKLVIGLIRLILPPQTDNEAAANYLIQVVGKQCEAINWVVVRPDELVDQPDETEYSLSETPVRSPIFNSGKTSRINAAAFMAELAMNNTLMDLWKFQSPVIYNSDSMSK